MGSSEWNLPFLGKRIELSSPDTHLCRTTIPKHLVLVRAHPTNSKSSTALSSLSTPPFVYNPNPGRGVLPGRGRACTHPDCRDHTYMHCIFAALNGVKLIAIPDRSRVGT
jgi:hypothetical protein